MSKTLPQQSRFKILVSSKKGETDITNIVGDTVTLETEINRISHLEFELKDPDNNAQLIRIGTKVIFYGGYLDGAFFTDSLGQTPNFKKLFVGTARRFNLQYKEDGTVSAMIECISFSWSSAGYSNLTFTYPSKNNIRQGANTTKIKVSELVKLIADANGQEAFIHVGENTDTEYTLTSPVVQKKMSDFAFLQYLAKRNSCYVWYNHDNQLFFVDKSKAHSEESNRLKFLWVGRGKYEDGTSRGFHKDSFIKNSPDHLTADKDKLYHNQILLNSVSLTEDPGMYGQNIAKITDFSITDTSGKEVDVFRMYDEDADSITYYQLNTELIESMQKTDDGSKELTRLMEMGAMDIPWEEAQKYYKPIVIEKKIIDSIDGQVLGITVNATCNGNVNIEPFQSYPIQGIARYRAMKSKDRSYFLRNLTHKWEEGEFTTEMEFRI